MHREQWRHRSDTEGAIVIPLNQISASERFEEPSDAVHRERTQ